MSEWSLTSVETKFQKYTATYLVSGEKNLYRLLSTQSWIPKLQSSGVSTFVENLNFFPITEESLSVELNLKENATVDIFYLESPGRFVIDIKK
jgi:hypothetical protein